MAEPLNDDPISFFPDPPPFYKHFTPENVERIKEIKQETGGANADDKSFPQLSAEQLLSLPTELRYLIPPEPPAEDEEFRVFGEVAKAHGTDQFKDIVEWMSFHLNQTHTLDGWEYKQLYPSPPSDSGADATIESNWSIDRQNYLFRFLRSIVLSFVELLGIVANDPTSEHKDAKVKDILTMVTNMHALINEYRPHQARETLINLMQEQLDRKKAEVEGIKRMKDKVKQTLDGFSKVLETPGKTDVDKGEFGPMWEKEERRREGQRRMWEALDETVGS